MAFRRSLQRRYRTGLTPVSLFSPNRGSGHWLIRNPQLMGLRFKELSMNSGFALEASTTNHRKLENILPTQHVREAQAF